MSSSTNMLHKPAVGAPSNGNQAPNPGALGGKYLTFFLGVEEYGLEILKVQEIIGMMAITPVPGTSGYIRGVINLRGRVIPIIDVRVKFCMQAVDQTDETCIIVVQAHGVQVGMVVDKVSEVLDIAADDIEEAPVLGTSGNTEFILGIGKSEGRIKLLLDIDKVLAGDNFGAITPQAPPPPEASPSIRTEPTEPVAATQPVSTAPEPAAAANTE